MKHNSRYYLIDIVSGRYVTNDTRTGPALTPNRHMAYCYGTEASAYSQKLLYERTLNVGLRVVAFQKMVYDT